jgi:hypothetical protein
MEQNRPIYRRYFESRKQHHLFYFIANPDTYLLFGLKGASRPAFETTSTPRNELTRPEVNSSE